MWTATALVLLLLSVDMQVRGAVGKTRGSDAENSKPEKMERKEETRGTHSSSTTDAASSGFKGNLLVIPMDGSHWIDIKALAQEMGRRGHRVTVVMPEVSMRMGPGKHFDTVFYPVPYNKSSIDAVLSTHKDFMGQSKSSFYEKISKRLAQIQSITGIIHTSAESLLFNTSLISHLAQQVSPTIPGLSTAFNKKGIV